jgi:hypothetical protein
MIFRWEAQVGSGLTGLLGRIPGAPLRSTYSAWYLVGVPELGRKAVT